MKILIAVLLFASAANAQYPDGTIIMSSKKGLVGRIAKRLTGGDQYTHSAIVFDGYAYESDWPRAKRTPVGSYGKRGTTNDYFIPTGPVSVDAMRAKANSMLGQPYRLRNYFRPGSPKVHGTWCSPYVGQVLNAGGYQLSPQQYHEPQSLLQAVSPNFRYVGTVTR
jgi:hypothetical protein